jgi:hypothetical protein
VYSSQVSAVLADDVENSTLRLDRDIDLSPPVREDATDKNNAVTPATKPAGRRRRRGGTLAGAPLV